MLICVKLVLIYSSNPYAQAAAAGTTENYVRSNVKVVVDNTNQARLSAMYSIVSVIFTIGMIFILSLFLFKF
jgi:hypothetical protein